MPKPSTSTSPSPIPNKPRSSTYDYSVPDPPLTSLGEQQARSISETYPFLSPSSSSTSILLVSSPLRRALQTSLLGFHRNPLPHAGFQENSAKPCDTGSPLSILREEFPELNFEFVQQGWDSKKGEWAPDETSLATRAGKMRRWLKGRPENEIVVVTHGGTLSFFLCEGC